jgi:hypothetical protein
VEGEARFVFPRISNVLGCSLPFDETLVLSKEAGAGNHEVVMDFSRPSWLNLLKWLLGQKDSLNPRTAITAEGRD